MRNATPFKEAKTDRLGPLSIGTLVGISFVMIIAGAILLAISASSTGQGGIVIIFPFVFGSANSRALLLPAIVLAILMLILTLLPLRRTSE